MSVLTLWAFCVGAALLVLDASAGSARTRRASAIELKVTYAGAGTYSLDMTTKSTPNDCTESGKPPLVTTWAYRSNFSWRFSDKERLGYSDGWKGYRRRAVSAAAGWFRGTATNTETHSHIKQTHTSCYISKTPDRCTSRAHLTGEPSDGDPDAYASLGQITTGSGADKRVVGYRVEADGEYATDVARTRACPNYTEYAKDPQTGEASNSPYLGNGVYYARPIIDSDGLVRNGPFLVGKSHPVGLKALLDGSRDKLVVHVTSSTRIPEDFPGHFNCAATDSSLAAYGISTVTRPCTLDQGWTGTITLTVLKRRF